MEYGAALAPPCHDVEQGPSYSIAGAAATPPQVWPAVYQVCYDRRVQSYAGKEKEASMATMVRPRRSVLYMPGANARALEKARTLAADGLVFDLEDAVAPDAKGRARQQVVEAIRAGGYGKRELIVRVN